jgi:hypothetical protein
MIRFGLSHIRLCGIHTRSSSSRWTEHSVSWLLGLHHGNSKRTPSTADYLVVVNIHNLICEPRGPRCPEHFY